MSVNKEKQIWEQVGTVVALNCYPVKSCREIPVEQAFCTKLGLKVDNAVDRYWLVMHVLLCRTTFESHIAKPTFVCKKMFVYSVSAIHNLRK